MAPQSNSTTRRRRRGLLAVALTAALGVAGGVVPVGAGEVVGTSSGVAVTPGSLFNVVDQVGARALWEKGITGKGVNVAVVDTGIAPMDALSGSDKVVAVVDLSNEAGVAGVEYRDTYGHGTHMAGIIAGRDPGAVPAQSRSNPQWFLGVAPDAGIVSVKVAGSDGSVDVSQVIAGVDWVTDHAKELNIRVLNLSYSSASTLNYVNDPLSYAVERAWRAGIVVVVAAGNDGRNMSKLGMPAQNPYVIAVAAAEAKDSGGFRIPTWVSSGDGTRNPDLSAPGASIVSLRAPSSRVALEHPEGYVTEQLLKGSGSSQAAAVVSGTAALMLSAHPFLTPDQVKAQLMNKADATKISPSSVKFSGKGLVRVDQAVVLPKKLPAMRQSWTPSTGTGSLDAARGGEYITVNGEPLTGEVTVLGTTWDGARWLGARWLEGSWDGARWLDGSWMGARWLGSSWTGARWLGDSWTGARWLDQQWSGARWLDESWTGARWLQGSWVGARWLGTWD